MISELQKVFRRNIVLIDMIDKIIYYFHVQNYDKALRTSAEFLEMLNENMPFLQRIMDQERFELMNSILMQIFEAQNSMDYVFEADLYELRLRRFLTDLQEDIIASDDFTHDESLYNQNLEICKKIDKDLFDQVSTEGAPWNLSDQGYEMEFTSTGRMTLAMTDKLGRYYFHSNSSVTRESFSLANTWYQEEVTGYIVYGLGMGYHIRQLLYLDSSIHIDVFEADLNIIRLATGYTPIAEILARPTVRLIYDPDFTKLINRISNIKEDEKFVIHYPSLRNVSDSAMKDKLEDYFIQYSSVSNQIKLLNSNFRKNIVSYDNLVDDLRDEFRNRDLYIIAAGPSLDKNFLELKQLKSENSILMATGTVFRKLLESNISPDYLIVTDANERVYGQINGKEACRIPMLFLSTAFYGFAKNYQGKKYIILQKDYDKSEEFAAEHHATVYQTGGSVSTTALDIGIQFGCKRIIFLGLDLAFTDNYVHASNTSRRELTNTNDLRQVEDIHGDLVYTSRSLDMYRKWIEKRIDGVTGIEFIDATEGGAKIKGMKIMKLADCINSNNN